MAPKRDIDFLRKAVRMLGDVNEHFNQRHNVTELLEIVACWMQCAWDIPPDAWSDRQVKLAIRGVVPNFRLENGDYFPVYS